MDISRIPNLDDCPCSGKNMSNLAAPWVLLTLYRRGGLHGYEIVKSVRKYIEEVNGGLNVSGFYRHLSMLEKRGMLSSEWDRTKKGPAKKVYALTETGRLCLSKWIKTLETHLTMVTDFLGEANKAAEGPEPPLCTCSK
jgi:DNA-binding PadR family transcriptional regulator